MTLEQLTKHASARSGRIVTRRPYIEDIQTCLAHDGCPAKLLGIGGDQWAKMLESADDMFVYADPMGIVEPSSVKSMSGNGWGDLEDSSDIPKKSLLVYDAVLATKDKDRDGDVVHPDGMVLETKMPLLWQHVWSSPIGVMVKTIEQNSDRVVNRYAIADTPLGKDAATLVEMGALRKSHGFLPMPGHYSPIDIVKDAKGQSIPTGFDIRKLNVYESSLVSVPAGANAVVLRSYEKELDAIYTAVSEKKLTTDVVKNWAERHYENRTKVFGGATIESTAELVAIESEPQRVIVDINVKSADSEAKDTKKKPKRKCDCNGDTCDCKKDDDVKVEPMTYGKSLKLVEKYIGEALPDYMPGSYEEVIEAIRDQAGKKLGGYDAYVHVIATFADSAIVCHVDYSGRERTKMCYRVEWSYDDDKPKISGEMKEVEISPVVMEKHFGRNPLPQLSDTSSQPEHEVDPVLALFDCE